MPEPRTPVDIARAIANAFDRNAVPYAIGGALALAFYSPPRATVDVDVNAFIDVGSQMQRVLDVLGELGFTSEGTSGDLITRAAESGQVRGTIEGMRVDVFVPAVPYYGEIQTRTREVTLLGEPLRILGPEDLAVLKMMFFRRKDLADVEALYRDQGSKLDRSFVRSRLVEFVGKDDERLSALTSIERDT
ncbi:MAG: hypothetical protein NVSMB57_16620 [Actinomycetota bacterium]